MKKTLSILFAAVGLFASSLVHATTINFFTTPLGGSNWRYDYTVVNDSLAIDIDEFSIFFDRNLFSNLAIASSPTDWDSIVFQPDPGLPADGFFDSLALIAGLAPRASLGGFSVTFTFAGTGIPGSQRFDIVDPLTFAVLDSGFTSPTRISEPDVLPLLVFALFLAVMRSRMQPAATTAVD